jgi:pseudaminic acid cytidylyltransferase
MNYAVIPARGGSKRIPRKNIREFNGVPAIMRTIQFIVATKMFSEIIVSTDDDEIADISLKAGATRIIKRGDDLSNDYTPTVPVIADALQKFGIVTGVEINVCCFYPINPFLKVEIIDEGLLILKSKENISYVNPIVSFPYPIDRALRKSDLGFINMANPQNLTKRSQEFEEFFHDAGQWYWGKLETWISQAPLLENSIGVPVSRWVAQDIDTIEDWKQAELLSRLI